MTRICKLPTVEERSEALIPARRAARYHAAERRVQKILDGTPPLSAEQLVSLATILLRAVAKGDDTTDQAGQRRRR